MANLGTLVAASFVVALVLTAVGTMARLRWVERISDLVFVVFYLSAGALIWGVHQRLADQIPLMWFFTILALVALALQLVNQILVAVSVVTFAKVAIVQTVAFAVLLLWMGAVSVITVSIGELPQGLGWLGLLTVVGAVALLAVMSRDTALVKGERNPTRTELMVAVVPFVALTAWFYWAGASL